MNIAIIPAKEFSKRLKNKNIKILNNQPIISTVIKKLINSKIFDKIYVSTDSNKISKISIKCGAHVNELRPKYLCKNSTTIIDVMNYEVKKLKKKYNDLKFVCCAFPTAVFIEKKHLLKSYRILNKNNKKFVFSVKKVDQRLFKSFYITKNNTCQYIFKKNISIDSKKLSNVYLDAGQFYFSHHRVWVEKKDIDLLNNYLIEINNPIDIDDINDWKKLINLHGSDFNKKSS